MLAEMEEKKICDLKWTPLPPPNVQLYLKKPVVLLNWEADDIINNGHSDNYPKDEDYTTTANDVIDLDSLVDDDSFVDADISELTARLEDVAAEKELYIIGSQDRENSKVENQGAADVRGNDHIPPAPDFNIDDDDDDEEYGNSSDMDLFGNEDLDRLYDNVDQQLQQGDGKEGGGGFGMMMDISFPAVVDVRSEVTVLGITPSKVQPCPQEGVSGHDSQSRNADVKPSFQRQTSQQGGSKTQNLRERSSSNLQGSMVERTSETTIADKVIRHHDSSVSQPSKPQQPALRARSSSSEYKFSPDSDDLDLPPVNWGHTSRPTASTSTATSHSTAVKEEQPRAHCSKDVLQTSASSLVAEKCPICNLSFPIRYICM